MNTSTESPETRTIPDSQDRYAPAKPYSERLDASTADVPASDAVSYRRVAVSKQGTLAVHYRENDSRIAAVRRAIRELLKK